jgi:hypothetical protein
VDAREVAPDDAWLNYDGDPKGTTLAIPNLAKIVGIFGADAEEMAELRRRYEDARDGVAMRIGNAVVVGAFRRGLKFAEARDASNLELGGVRITNKGIRLLPGLVLGEMGVFSDRDLAFRRAESAQGVALVTRRQAKLGFQRVPIVSR